MKPERIEELLRVRPPDEPAYQGSAPRLGEPVRQPRRVVGGSLVGVSGAGGVLITLVVLVVLASRLGPSNPGPSGSAAPSSAGAPSPSGLAGAIPWTSDPYVAPTPEPTPAPDGLALCPQEQIALLAGGWSGATGSMGGGISLINAWANPCRLEAPTSIVLRDALGAVIASNASLSLGTVVGVPSGGVAGATVVWSNWCGSTPPLPLSLTVTMRLGTDTGSVNKTLAAPVMTDPARSSVPRCDVPSAPSGIDLVEFQSGQSSLGDYARQPCRPSDLRAYGGGWGAAAGSWYGQVVLVNVTAFDCDLPPQAGVEVRDPDGRVIVSGRAQSPSVTAISAQGSLSLQLITADWCGPAPKLPLAVDVVLGTGRVRVDELGPAGGLGVPSCMSAPATPAPVFLVGPLVAPAIPVDQPPPDPGDLLSPFMGVTISLPQTAAAGRPLIYSVTLTNNDAYHKPINLAAECPSYTEQLLVTGEAPITARYLLNCGPAGVLDAGASLTFEMRIDVPSSAAPGVATVAWQLGQTTGSVKEDLRIVDQGP